MDERNYDHGVKNGERSATLDSIQREMKRGFNRLFDQNEIHRKYHEENESKWGIIAIMRNHPLGTMLAGAGTLFVFLLIIYPNIVNHPFVKVIQGFGN